MRWWDEECLQRFDLDDPLLSNQTVPVSDREAEWLEEICQAATPGPLVIDEQSDGGGVLVATLPDGRLLVSRDAEVRLAEDAQSESEANATLFGQAQSAILRLLRERRQWLQDEQVLRDKIQVLEVQWEREHTRSAEANSSLPPR